MARLHAGAGSSSAQVARDAVREALTQARKELGDVAPRLAYLAWSVEHDASVVVAALREALPGVPIHGASSSLGVCGPQGITAGAHGAVGILLIGADADVALHVAYAPVEADGREAGRKAAAEIMSKGQPKLIWMHASPGKEEDVLLGIADEAPGVPVFGGSAADNAIAGEWRVVASPEPIASGVSLAAIYGELRAGGAMLAPHSPTGRKAVVTRSNDRLLETLDGRPAASVLREWIGESIGSQVEEGGNILAQTSLHPIAFPRTGRFGVHHVTVHPAVIHVPGGEVDLFARAPQGSELCLMQGTPEQLVDGLDPLITAALASIGASASEVRAGVLIYCAGCAGAVGPLLHEGLTRHLLARLPGVPILGMFTFGEQGNVPGLGNLHQDLSLSLSLIAD